MKYLCRLIVSGLCFLLVVGSASPALSGQPDTCFIPKIAKGSIRLDGELNEPVWKDAGKIDGIHDAWDSTYVLRTVFGAVHDGKALYYYFRAEDTSVVIKEKFEREQDLNHCDRIELFFATNESLLEYYGVEIGPNGEVHDFSTGIKRNYKSKGGRFVSDWDMGNVSAKARITSEGYQVEARIPLKGLKKIGLKVGKEAIMVGVFRADLNRHKGKTHSNWLSWMRPDIETPSFHVPSAFGRFKFMSK